MAKKLHIQALSINHLRGLKDFQANNFGQLNLITGRNNSGKTTLLEGIFLALGPGNPELWLNINSRRGVGIVGRENTTIPYLFYGLDTSTPITIDVSTRDYSSYSVEISTEEYIKKIQTDTSMPTGTFSSTDINTNPEINQRAIVITYKPQDGNVNIAKATIVGDEIQFSNPVTLFPTSVFISPGTYSMEIDARRYDTINRKGLKHRFENLLKQFLPDLREVTLGIENGVPTLLVDVGFGLVPLALLGSGAKRMASIFLAISDASNAIVLIDEIETGFHHLIYSDVWRSIMDFANAQHAQIFATTHSDEFIRACVGVVQKSDINFKLHRLSNTRTSSELKTFEKEEAIAAIEGGWDVR